jgi:hypothetical protein
MTAFPSVDRRRQLYATRRSPGDQSIGEPARAVTQVHPIQQRAARESKNNFLESTSIFLEPISTVIVA